MGFFYVRSYLYDMKIIISEEQKKKLFKLIEGDSKLVDKLSPENRGIYNKIFSSKGDNSEFNEGYKKGYADGWMDSRGNQKYDDTYSWDKYSEKKR